MKKNLLLRVLLLLVIVQVCNSALAVTYYNRTASTVLNGNASWTTSANGVGGTNPSSLTASGDVFVIRAGTELTTNANLSMRSLTIEQGAKLTLAHRCAIQTALVVNGHLVYNVNASWSSSNIFSGTETFGANSVFEILNGTPTTLPTVNSWGSILFYDNSFSGNWDLDIVNNTVVKGDLVVQTTDDDRITLFANSCDNVTIEGNLDLRDGSVMLADRNARTITLKNSFLVTGDAELIPCGERASQELVFDGANCFWQVTSANYDRENVSVTVKSGQRLQLNSTLSIGDDETLELESSAHLVAGSQLVRGNIESSQFIMGSNSTLHTSNSMGVTGWFIFLGTIGIDLGTMSISPTANFSFTGSSNVSFGSSYMPLTSGRLNIGSLSVNLTSAAKLTLDNNITCNGGLNVATGAVLTIPSSATLRRGTSGSCIINGRLESFDSDGAFGTTGTSIEGYSAGQIELGSTSTVVYAGLTAQIVSALVPYAGLELSGSGTRSTSANVVVNGTFTHTGGTLNISDDRLELNGPLVGSATITDNSQSEIRIGNHVNAANWSYGATLQGSFNIQRSTGVNLATNLIVNGTLTLGSGSLNLGAFGLTIGGNVTGTGALSGSTLSSLTIAGGNAHTMSAFQRPSVLGSLVLAPTSPRTYRLGNNLTISNSLSINSVGVLDLGSHQLLFSGSTITTAPNSSITGSLGSILSFENRNTEFTLPNSLNLGSPVILRVNAQNGGIGLSNNLSLSNLDLASGYLSIGNGNTLTISGNLTGSQGILRGSNTSNITISGAGALSYAVPFAQTSSFGTVQTFTMNRSGASIQLGSNLLIAAGGTVTLSNGSINTGNHVLTLASTASLSNEDVSRRVIGTVQTTRLVGNSASSFGNLGYQISGGADNLGEVTCIRKTGAGSAVTSNGKSSINCVYDINITGAQPSSGRVITMEWLSDDDNGKNFLSRNALVYRRETPSSPWVRLRRLTTGPSFQITGNRRSITAETFHFSEYTVTDDANTLPVTLSSFTGEATTEGNELRWTTSQEVNNSGFTLQRSLDGNVYTDMTFVKGRGTVSNTSQYQYLDTQAPELAYYRLIQEDLDGTKEVFKTITVRRANQVEKVRPVMTLWPNPATTELNLSVTGAPASYKLAVWDATGREMHTAASIAEKLNVSAWPSGLYTVQLISIDGTEIRKTFVKP